MKNNIDKSLRERFDDWFNINKDYLKTRGTFSPVVCLIDKNDKVIFVMLMFKNSREKEIMRTGIKLLALSKNLKGYFFASDTKATLMNKENPKKSKVYDAFIQLLCSPNGSFQKMFIHNGKGKEIKVPEFSEDKLETYDVQTEWDAWNEPLLDDEANERYIQFKKLHPDLFKEVE